MAQQLPPDPGALHSITAFQNLPAEVLHWLSEHGKLCQYTDGEVIVEPGAAAEYMMGVLSGEMQFYRTDNGRHEPVFRVEAGRLSGVLPYSRLQVSRGQAIAVGDAVLYLLPRTEFPALEQVSPELIKRLVGIMSDRARDEVRSQERDDKMRALGKLSAGLAHELNNPAAAIARAADALNNMLKSKPILLKNLLSACPPAEAVSALLQSGGLPQTPPPPRSALARADAEEELADWLETQGCPDGYALAPNLLDAGHTADTLAPLVAPLPPRPGPRPLPGSKATSRPCASPAIFTKPASASARWWATLKPTRTWTAPVAANPSTSPPASTAHLIYLTTPCATKTCSSPAPTPPKPARCWPKPASSTRCGPI